jgi:hypothetical protein
MEATRSSETSVLTRFTRRHIAEDDILQNTLEHSLERPPSVEYLKVHKSTHPGRILSQTNTDMTLKCNVLRLRYLNQEVGTFLLIENEVKFDIEIARNNLLNSNIHWEQRKFLQFCCIMCRIALT